MKEVVSAIIVKKGVLYRDHATLQVPRIALTQRRTDKDFALTWECPGGKVEDGESHTAALSRELVEELGIWPVEVLPRPAWQSVVDLGKRGDKRITFYVVRSWAGNITAREGQGLGWFTSEEMKGLELAPANKLALYDVARAIATLELEEAHT